MSLAELLPAVPGTNTALHINPYNCTFNIYSIANPDSIAVL